MEEYGRGYALDLFSPFAKAGNRVSLIKELFPLPETPVTVINRHKGNFTSTDFKLFPEPPEGLISFG